MSAIKNNNFEKLHDLIIKLKNKAKSLKTYVDKLFEKIMNLYSETLKNMDLKEVKKSIPSLENLGLILKNAYEALKYERKDGKEIKEKKADSFMNIIKWVNDVLEELLELIHKNKELKQENNKLKNDNLELSKENNKLKNELQIKIDELNNFIDSDIVNSETDEEINFFNFL
jgi:predicted RNase H-like nuclease (RuvC/YqgF family)